MEVQVYCIPLINSFQFGAPLLLQSPGQAHFELFQFNSKWVIGSLNQFNCSSTSSLCNDGGVRPSLTLNLLFFLLLFLLLLLLIIFFLLQVWPILSYSDDPWFTSWCSESIRPVEYIEILEGHWGMCIMDCPFTSLLHHLLFLIQPSLPHSNASKSTMIVLLVGPSVSPRPIHQDIVRMLWYVHYWLSIHCSIPPPSIPPATELTPFGLFHISCNWLTGRLNQFVLFSTFRCEKGTAVCSLLPLNSLLYSSSIPFSSFCVAIPHQSGSDQLRWTHWCGEKILFSVPPQLLRFVDHCSMVGVQRYRGNGPGRSYAEYIFRWLIGTRSTLIWFHLILSLYNQLHTLYFSSCDLTCAVQDVVDPHNCVDPHSWYSDIV